MDGLSRRWMVHASRGPFAVPGDGGSRIARVPVDVRPSGRGGQTASSTPGGSGPIVARLILLAVLGWASLGAMSCSSAWAQPSGDALSEPTAKAAEATRPDAVEGPSPGDAAQPATPPSSNSPGTHASGTWPEPRPASSDPPSAGTTGVDWQQWLSFDRLQSTAQLAISMTVLGVVPALLLMTTSYVRISVVLALLRQAFGVPNLLPLQVTTALAFFCTGWIMWPTWQLVHEKAVLPAVAGQAAVDPARLWAEGIGPVRQFMVEQIEASRNSEDVHLFLSRTMKPGEAYPASYEEVPLAALLPAFLLSELKTAFLIGFQIYLPFLVIDLVVSAVTTSMGMFLLPPATIAMPLKLLTFVLVDGWRLVVDMLLKSFQ